MSHFVNSEAVFSVIGDYPVVDQFDVGYSLLQSGSTHDAYVTGSLLRYFTTLSGKKVLLQGERGRAFSKLGVEQSTLPARKNAARVSYELQPWRERSGTIKNVRLFSNDERFYDSLTPNLSKLLKVLTGSIVKYNLGSFGIYNAIIFDNDPYNPVDSLGITPQDFELNFPFAPKFSGIGRDRKLSQSIISTVDTSNNPVKPFQTKNLLIVEAYSGSHFTASTGPIPSSSFNANYWLDDISLYTVPLFFGKATSEVDSTKILFGFGDRSSYMEKGEEPDAQTVIGRKNLPERRFFADQNTSYISIGPIIRGWRYGLVSGLPHYTSCIFRRDSYGQLRDMLEQREIITSLSDEENNPINTSINSSEQSAMPYIKAEVKQSTFSSIDGKKALTQKTFTLDPPIKISFVKKVIAADMLTYYPEQPENTWSSNLSTYATSSLPYFDSSEGKNRVYTPESPRTQVIKTFTDNFGRRSIG